MPHIGLILDVVAKFFILCHRYFDSWAANKNVELQEHVHKYILLRVKTRKKNILASKLMLDKLPELKE